MRSFASSEHIAQERHKYSAANRLGLIMIILAAILTILAIILR